MHRFLVKVPENEYLVVDSLILALVSLKERKERVLLFLILLFHLL